MSVLKQVGTVILDCADPAALAAFYRKATGWEITYSDDDLVYLGDGSGPQLGFQRIEGYEAPAWPSPAKQAHLDFGVADMEAAADELVKLGAERPESQPGDGQWIVLIDPAGHPFCIAS
ncbi:VOC family protein [Actinomadura harenae]|uniref:VOC family protein n=1 Tax=Actinomadura harenae TaxID=2483351 RepID=A0A3M2LTW0_9ACTN|nr:VOC family protein [Actinomadura harenae]RMI39495.1 VOC family protein [Actinomadura harenae]